MFRIEIPCLLPTFNDIVGENRFIISKLKKELYQMMFVTLKASKIPKPLHFPITLTIAQWCGRKGGRLRDVDSGSFAVKTFLDSLVKFDYLPDDSPKYVAFVHHQAPQKGKADKTVFLIQ